MKKIYILLLLLVTMLPATAQQMIVESNEKTESIEFANLDKITFDGVTVRISQVVGNVIEASMSDISRITFSNYDCIDAVEDFEGALFSSLSSDAITVNCSAGELVRVYDVVGTMHMCVRQNSDNGVVSIAQLPKGIYIIRVDDRTAKFLKR